MKQTLAAIVLSVICSTANADFAVEFGYTPFVDQYLTLTKVGYVFNLPWNTTVGSSTVTWHIEPNVGTINPNNARGPITTFGLQPFGRLFISDKTYIEGGLGITYHTSTEYGVKDGRLYTNSSNVQFNTEFGVSYVMSKHWDVGIRYSHQSHGPISSGPNPGIDAVMFRLTRKF